MSENVEPDWQCEYGHRPVSNWGSGEIMSPYAEGDLVYIGEDAIAFTAGRIPHSWSHSPELCVPGVYVVVTAFSISEGDDWYFRVIPYGYPDEGSDRLHIIRGQCDYTGDWELILSADPEGIRPRSWIYAGSGEYEYRH